MRLIDADELPVVLSYKKGENNDERHSKNRG